MNIQNALELDLNEAFSPSATESHGGGLKLFVFIVTVICLLIWSLKIGEVIQRWAAPRAFPSTFNVSPLLKVQTSSTVSYYFKTSTSSFQGLDLSRIREIPVLEFEAMILADTPNPIRNRMRPYLPLALKMGEYYQVDPFWVLAVMWTESHFNPRAVSRVRAQGLMQIMPATGGYLTRRMKKTVTLTGFERQTDVTLFDPHLNIEMGTYYLRYLLTQFKGNYRLATVAYNMGPNGVRRRLRQKLPTGVHNQYLNKVRRAYQTLTRSYVSYLNTTTPPYAQTYAAAANLRPVYRSVAPLAAFPFETGQDLDLVAQKSLVSL
jgi:soluble lytic murein transglycosylase-like protein